MKKKILPLLFTALCLLICAVPSAGMLFKATTEPIGNERKASPPSLTENDGSFNQSYLSDIGGYFEKTFAFRPELITADSSIQSGLFRSSGISTVISGTDGWLYFTSTLDDYLGRDTLTQREINGIIYNLNLIREYTKDAGADFLFTIAPNKNTLYPEHMPYYYSAKVGDIRNRDLLNSALSGTGFYADLFSVFSEQDETLYFVRDSHWNNKGALLACDSILTAAGKAHDDYSAAEVSRRKDHTGDLSRMMYPAGSEPEYDSYYGAEERYTYVTDTESVEDEYIQTACPDASGKLYMYRDSFGNALLPFMAAAYGEATFTKAFPMLLEKEMNELKPDIFIMELVERNVDWLITRPPVFPSKTYSLSLSDISSLVPDSDGMVSVTAQKCMYSSDYIEFTGEVDDSLLSDSGVIQVAVTDRSGSSAAYDCYTLKAEGNKTGFVAYAHAGDYEPGEELEISVITIEPGDVSLLRSRDKFTLGGK